MMFAKRTLPHQVNLRGPVFRKDEMKDRLREIVQKSVEAFETKVRKIVDEKNQELKSTDHA
jgi:hypothetical protein